MGQISQIFGKEAGIKRSDLESHIVEEGLVESLNLEYKSVGSADKLDDGLAESVLIKPLVSFMNGRERRSCLLIIGVGSKRHVPTDLEPVPDSVLTSERIQSLITSQIGSLPLLPGFPDVLVVPVKCGTKGSVFLVELRQWSAGAYFSRLSDLSYIREGDSSRKLSLPEFFEISRQQSGSAASMDVTEVSSTFSAESGRTTYMIRLMCTNYGNRPAVFVGGFVGLEKSSKLALVSTVAPGDFRDVSNLNPRWTRMWSFEVNQPGGAPVFPRARIVFDGLKFITTGRCAFGLNVETHDGDGMTVRSYRITPTGQLKPASYKRTPWS